MKRNSGGPRGMVLGGCSSKIRLLVNGFKAHNCLAVRRTIPISLFKLLDWIPIEWLYYTTLELNRTRFFCGSELSSIALGIPNRSNPLTLR